LRLRRSRPRWELAKERKRYELQTCGANWVPISGFRRRDGLLRA
jgi:hypothetical protein